MTVLYYIRLSGTTECIVFAGTVERNIFDAYVKSMLAPALQPGNVVIMDNFSVHKLQAAYDAIHAMHT